MKKETYLFMAFILAGGILFGLFGTMVILEAYQHEIHTVQNLAGKILTSAPEMENDFLEALGDMDRQDSEAGNRILERYGYDAQKKLKENERYRHTLRVFGWGLSGLVVMALAGAYSAGCLSERRKKNQEAQVLSVLEGCLSGAFNDNEEALEKFEDRRFADMLGKIGEKIQLKSELLEEEQDATKTLVTDISHQLRTPISALRVCFALYTEARTREEQTEFKERCEKQIEKMELLTDALGGISRLETHMISLHPEWVSFTEILTDSVNSIYHKAFHKQISIEMEELEEVTLRLDKKWTAEAVSNVLDNAIKYSPAGSRILIRATMLVHFLRLEIEDSGAGISKKERNQIFRRFYRGENEVVKKEEGTGVGLYLARKIIEEEGGTISVYPAKEKGSVFVIQLPKEFL